MRAVLPSVLLAACSFTPRQPGEAPGVDAVEPDAPPSEAGFVRPIEVTGSVSGGPHAEFPLLVAVSDSDLRSKAQGGKVETGFDLGFFADAEGRSRLAHEVEAYDATDGELIAWVKVPMLAADTTIFLHYGDPAITASQEDAPAVWSAGYVGVWHLTDMADSTSLNPATDVATTGATGQVGAARAFGGAPNNVIAAPGAVTLDGAFGNGGTFEAWINATGSGGDGFGRVFNKVSVALGRCDGHGRAQAMMFVHGFSAQDANWCTSPNSAPSNTWLHVAVTFAEDGLAEPLVYIDGRVQTVQLQQTSSGTPLADTGQALRIGNRADEIRTFAGIIDEVRLARAVRDAGWLRTAHDNQRDPGAFVGLRSEL